MAQPAAAPDPVTGNRVDDGRDEEAVDQVGRELGAFSHGTGNNRGRSSGKDQLEEPESQDGQTGHIVTAADEEAACADPAASGCTKHEGIAKGPESQAGKDKVDQVFEQDVGGVLRAGQTSFNKSKTGLHPENQEGGDQHPEGVQTAGQSQAIGSGPAQMPAGDSQQSVDTTAGTRTQRIHLMERNKNVFISFLLI